jgi:hypothetical protein
MSLMACGCHSFFLAVVLQALFGELSPDVMVLTVLYSLAGEQRRLSDGGLAVTPK